LNSYSDVNEEKKIDKIQRFSLYLLLLSFAYVFPLVKLPYGKVTALRLDDFVWVIVVIIWIMRRGGLKVGGDRLHFSLSLYVASCAISMLVSFFVQDGASISIPFIYSGFFFVKLLQYVSIYFIVSS